jgi:uncharacterized protein YecE (DUF72 family)
MIKVGCSGFPVAQKFYQSKLGLVEMRDLFDKYPRETTLEKWRANAPAGFEFVACASKVITHEQKHPRWGRFQESADTRHAFHQSVKQAKALNARSLVFSLPKNLSAHPDTIGRLQKFFHTKDRGALHLVLDVPRSWPATLVQMLAKSVRFVAAINPLHSKPDPQAPMRYYRLGTNKDTNGIYRYSDSELREIKSKCDKPLSYVIFNNGPTAFMDALRFSKLVN